MFKNEFQGGPYFEVFSTQGKDSTSGWKMPSSGCRKVYDKEVKGYVYILEGTSATTKMHLPKDSRISCTLVQHFLVLQLNIFLGKEFSVELGVSDLGNNKRRIFLSTSQKEISITPLHAKIPLTIVHRNLWLNLCFDMLSLVGDTWKGQTYRAIESITVSANCKIRRIFTMKVQPPDTTDDDELYGCCDVNTEELEAIPKQCQLSNDVTQATQVLTINKIRHCDRSKGDTSRPLSTLDLSNLDGSANSGRKSSVTDSNYHIAFGSKVPVPEHTRKINQLGNTTSRSIRSLSSRIDEGFGSDLVGSSITSQDGFHSIRSTQSAAIQHPVSSSHYHQHPDPVTADDDTTQSETLQDHVVAPHPPHIPSSDRLRRRPRVKNSVLHKDRQTSAGRDEVVSETGTANGQLCYRTVSVDSLTSDSSNTQAGGDTQTDRAVNSRGVRQPPPVPNRETKALPSLQSSRLAPASNRLRSSKEMGVGPDVPEIQKPQRVNDSVSHVIGLLNDKADSSDSSSDSDDRNSQPGEYEDSEEEDRCSDSRLHVFASKPTKAPLRLRSPGTDTGQKKISSVIRLSRSQVRGAQPENDFWSSSEEEEMHGKGWKSNSRPHSGTSSTGASPKTNIRSAGSHGRAGSGSHSRGGSGRGGSGSKNRGDGDSREISDDVKVKIPTSIPKQSSVSPDHKHFNPALYTSSTSSVVSISRSSVREIPKTDARLSQAADRPYDVSRYQMADVTDSFEAKMLQSMQRQEEDRSPDSPRKEFSLFHNSPRRLRPLDQLNPHIHSESPATTSDDDTSFSTWKAPAANEKCHNYQDEMKSRLSSDTLTSSNPRDWSGGIFSPPINFPNVGDLQNTATSDDLSESNLSPRKTASNSQGEVVKYTDSNEEELNLLFDSSLNCYYDPKTHKYYELAS